MRIETGRLVLLSGLLGLLVGALCVLLRFVLEWCAPLSLWLTGYAPPSTPGEGGLLMAFGEVHWYVLLVLPAAGALYSWLVPALPGAAFSQLVRGYHERGQWPNLATQGRALLGLLIGYFSGLLVGRDSIFLLVGQVGSNLLGRLTSLDTVERRTLVLAGASAALGAVLHAPLAAAVLVAEVLYRRFEFEFEVLMSCVLASIVSYATYGLVFGFAPLLNVNNPQVPSAEQALLYIGVALLVTMVAWALLWACRVLPTSLTDGAWRPAMGAGLGLVMALLAWKVSLHVLGDGLGWYQVGLSGFLTTEGLEGGIWRWVLMALGARLAFGGGVFPSVAAGGLLGVGLGQWLGLDPVVAGLLGAVCFLTVTLNVPVASALLAIAWGGDVMLPVALLAAGIAHLVSGESGIVPGQISSRALSPVHRFSTEGAKISTRRIVSHLATAEVRGENVSNGNEITEDVANKSSPSLPNPTEESPKEPQKELFRRAIPLSWQGVPLKLLALPAEIEVVGLVRAGEVRVPRPEVRLVQDDELILLCVPAAYEALETLWGLS